MNVIGIDPSLISTAVVVNGEIINYCKESTAYNKSGLSKWFKYAEPYCEYRFIEYRKFDGYSEGEIIKLKDYDKVTEMIVEDIREKIDPNVETLVGIEGYNFGAQVGDLLDLVTFSTLLRKKIFDRVTENIIVFSPSSLKLESCKLTYPPIEIVKGVRKKRVEIKYRNRIGIAGGNFTKREMCQSIMENEEITDEWSDHIKSMGDNMTSMRNIPKPHEDINDAYLLYHILHKWKRDGNI